jgi:hypothetical protein
MTKRLSITGPCKINWQDGLRRTVETLHPELVKAPDAQREPHQQERR